MTEDTKLTEFDKDEWRDIARRVAPEMTDEEFETMWTKFHEIKDRKKLQ